MSCSSDFLSKYYLIQLQQLLLILSWMLLKTHVHIVHKNQWEYAFKHWRTPSNMPRMSQSLSLISKGALLLINSLAQIYYIKVPIIDSAKYKERKSSSCLLKMPSCFPSGLQELTQNKTGQRDAVKTIALKTPTVFLPQWLTAHRISLPCKAKEKES